MKKLFISIFVFFWLAIFLLPFYMEYSYIFEDMQLNPNDYARITDVEYKAVVVDEPDSQGKVVITERLTFDIHAASKDNLFWELWRDLPEDTIDGVKVDYTVNSVKQIMDDGTEVIYEESPKLYWDDYDYVSTNPYYGPGKWYHSPGPYNEDAARYECVFFYVDGLYREEVVFEIEYEMHNAALRYNDCSDLYLALYSGSTIRHLESFEGQILFPNEDMPSEGNYDVYTYGTNSNDFPVDESATMNPGYYTFYFDLDEDDLQFKPYNEYIEFDLVAHGEDKHIFTEYAPYNYYSSDDVLDEIYDEQQEYADTPGKYKTAKIIVCLILSALAIFILIYNLMAGRRMREKHMLFEPAVKPDYYRDIPSDLDPNFAASLVFCKHKPPKDDSGVYSAILLSLARKDYVELDDGNYNDLQIKIKTPSMRSPSSMYPHISQPMTAADQYNSLTSSMDKYNLYGATSNTAETQSTTATDNSYVNTETREPLTPCEQYYFNLLIRHANVGAISMRTFQQRISADYNNTDTFVRNMENSIVNIGVRDGYFQKADYMQPKRQMRSASKSLRIIGILALTLVQIISYFTRMDLAFGGYLIFGISCIISSIFLKSQANKYVLLTQFGEDEYAKWRGLYNFLNSDTLIHERTVVELPIWEKYLVYATAFGLSEKVIKAISLRCPEAVSSPILDNNYCRSGRFRHSGRSFRSAVRTGSSVARGGGGFGYGGGGRGGGGGGGGH